MSLRKKYILWYVASLIIPAIIFIGGAFLVYSIKAANSALSVTSLCLICFLLFLASGFWANFWYSGMLKIHMAWRVLAGVFNTVGFFYLLGYEKNLISAMQIVQKSTELCIAHWKTLIKYSLLYLVPIIVMGLVGGISFALSSRLHASASVNGLIALLIVTISMVATLWLSICLAQVIKNLLNGQAPASIKHTLLVNSDLLWPTIFTSLISALIILGGSLLFLVPGIIFSIWYAFVFYAVIFEKQRGLAALRYSKSMVVGRWFAILWRVTVPAMIFGLAAFLITSILQLPFVFLPENNTTTLINALLTNLVSIALMPLTATASVVLFLNAKKTKSTTSEPAIM